MHIFVSSKMSSLQCTRTHYIQFSAPNNGKKCVNLNDNRSQQKCINRENPNNVATKMTCDKRAYFLIHEESMCAKCRMIGRILNLPFPTSQLYYLSGTPHVSWLRDVREKKERYTKLSKNSYLLKYSFAM